jgi:cytochrome b involved in lipid metabolism
VLCFAAKDASEDFEDVGHSDSARDMLKDYYVGEFDTSSLPAKTVAARSAAATRAAAKGGEETSLLRRILQILVPLAILGLAIAVRFLTAKEPIKTD